MAIPPAPAAARNCAPILSVLRSELRDHSSVLEIGSGDGHHAVSFARALPHLRWQTSDLDENHSLIRARIESEGPDNVLPPMSLDVRTAEQPSGTYDAVYTCNTAHIMSQEAVERMLPLVAAALVSDGVFCCYGPFKRHGRFNAPSNEAFDVSLRSRGVSMGLRELADIDARLAEYRVARQRVYAMPSNNLLVVWRKAAA